MAVGAAAEDGAVDAAAADGDRGAVDVVEGLVLHVVRLVDNTLTAAVDVTEEGGEGVVILVVVESDRVVVVGGVADDATADVDGGVMDDGAYLAAAVDGAVDAGLDGVARVADVDARPDDGGEGGVVDIVLTTGAAEDIAAVALRGVGEGTDGAAGDVDIGEGGVDGGVGGATDARGTDGGQRAAAVDAAVDGAALDVDSGEVGDRTSGATILVVARRILVGADTGA